MARLRIDIPARELENLATDITFAGWKYLGLHCATISGPIAT